MEPGKVEVDPFVHSHEVKTLTTCGPVRVMPEKARLSVAKTLKIETPCNPWDQFFSLPVEIERILEFRDPNTGKPLKTPQDWGGGIERADLRRQDFLYHTLRQAENRVAEGAYLHQKNIEITNENVDDILTQPFHSSLLCKLFATPGFRNLVAQPDHTFHTKYDILFREAHRVSMLSLADALHERLGFVLGLSYIPASIGIKLANDCWYMDIVNRLWDETSTLHLLPTRDQFDSVKNFIDGKVICYDLDMCKGLAREVPTPFAYQKHHFVEVLIAWERFLQGRHGDILHTEHDKSPGDPVAMIFWLKLNIASFHRLHVLQNLTKLAAQEPAKIRPLLKPYPELEGVYTKIFVDMAQSCLAYSLSGRTKITGTLEKMRVIAKTSSEEHDRDMLWQAIQNRVALPPSPRYADDALLGMLTSENALAFGEKMGVERIVMLPHMWKKIRAEEDSIDVDPDAEVVPERRHYERDVMKEDAKEEDVAQELKDQLDEDEEEEGEEFKQHEGESDFQFATRKRIAGLEKEWAKMRERGEPGIPRERKEPGLLRESKNRPPKNGPAANLGRNKKRATLADRWQFGKGAYVLGGKEGTASKKRKGKGVSEGSIYGYQVPKKRLIAKIPDSDLESALPHDADLSIQNLDRITEDEGDENEEEEAEVNPGRWTEDDIAQQYLEGKEWRERMRREKEAEAKKEKVREEDKEVDEEEYRRFKADFFSDQKQPQIEEKKEEKKRAEDEEVDEEEYRRLKEEWFSDRKGPAVEEQAEEAEDAEEAEEAEDEPMAPEPPVVTPEEARRLEMLRVLREKPAVAAEALKNLFVAPPEKETPKKKMLRVLREKPAVAAEALKSLFLSPAEKEATDEANAMLRDFPDSKRGEEAREAMIALTKPKRRPAYEEAIIDYSNTLPTSGFTRFYEQWLNHNGIPAPSIWVHWNRADKDEQKYQLAQAQEEFRNGQSKFYPFKKRE